MRKVLVLASLAMLGTMFLAMPAIAQNSSCAQVRDRLNAGDDNLTSAELLACGLSPEAINPCEGNPDPSCARNLPPGAFPSINGPNGVGRNNACSGLPQGSPEAVACFEELIANLGESQQPQLEPEPKMEQTQPKVLPKTSGPAIESLFRAGTLLLGSGVVACATYVRFFKSL